ncbi:hypothetical protein [Paludibaculum fermentans]|uniref:Uncharacterized protein n=1 Tax=Paludibaculum fermentans TaxID=1473598 RepID=A0A7S7SKX5_PALFE|nr:hypothetical protein [Paludibaculum fermentans]QOY88794.1 hypothetical protein IRI77_02200 [Paludibaculum fermentans]
MSGNIEDLKERRIGADVFDRPVDYDTNSDHIVRSVAGEVRRRLGQYYAQSGTDSEMRIDLLAGSYVPQFRMVGEQPVPAAAAALPAVAMETKARTWGWWPPAVVLAICTVALVVWIASRAGGRATALEGFWKPLYSASTPVLLCVPGGGSGPNATEVQEPGTVIDFALAPSRRIHVYDAMVLAEVTGLLRANGKAYRLLNRAGATSFRDLQSGPFVLIGSLNNEWSLRLTKDFRFSIVSNGSGARVVDKQDPSNEAWRVEPNTPIEQMRRDYAIVSRFRDSQTEQTAVILAGIGPWGSLASGEFVTNPEYLKKLAGFVPANWRKRNLQVVISTDVIHGSSGPPNILAAQLF